MLLRSICNKDRCVGPVVPVVMVPWHLKPRSMRILGYGRLVTVISPAAVTRTLIGYAAESVVEIVVVDQLELIVHLR